MKNSIYFFLLFLSLSSMGQRFCGLDYRYVIPHEPYSKNHSLDGANVGYSIFEADMAFPIYMDETKEKTIFFGTFSYAFLSPDITISGKEKERIKNDIPKYIYDWPEIHNLNLEVFYYQNSSFARTNIT